MSIFFKIAKFRGNSKLWFIGQIHLVETLTLQRSIFETLIFSTIFCIYFMLVNIIVGYIRVSKNQECCPKFDNRLTRIMRRTGPKNAHTQPPFTASQHLNRIYRLYISLYIKYQQKFSIQQLLPSPLHLPKENYQLLIIFQCLDHFKHSLYQTQYFILNLTRVEKITKLWCRMFAISDNFCLHSQ